MAQSIFDLLVNLFFLVAVAAWLLALAETAGSFMLWRWVFQLGPALFSIRRQSPVVLALGRQRRDSRDEAAQVPVHWRQHLCLSTQVLLVRVPLQHIARSQGDA